MSVSAHGGEGGARASARAPEAARSFVAIVNPAAGGGRAGRAAERALFDLRARGVVIDGVYRTGGPRKPTMKSIAWFVGRTENDLCPGRMGKSSMSAPSCAR